MKRKRKLAIILLFYLLLPTHIAYANSTNSTQELEIVKHERGSVSSSDASKYYYNTGLKCPRKAIYKNRKYSLLQKVKKGDIVFEKKGGFSITHHIAIVEGVFTDKKKKKTYIRVIEAIDKGVKRGILDDVRMDEKQATVLRVKDRYLTKGGRTKSSTIKKVISFVVRQLGKEYSLNLLDDSISEKNENWYCSKLVWAAYKRQKIDIEGNALTAQPGVTPAEILHCKKLKKIVEYTEE